MHSKESSTRVPTQITCKFLDSASAARAEEGGGIIGVNRIPSTFVFRHLIATRENRRGIRCVRARIIGREIGLSTRCNKYRQNYANQLNLNSIFPIDDPRNCSHLEQFPLGNPRPGSPSGIYASQPEGGTSRRPGCGPGQPPFQVFLHSPPGERRPDRSFDFHRRCWPPVPPP
jgi:hypothetical protein